MPARSSSMLLRAEMKITGMSPKVGFFLMARQSSKPSIQLIITSSRITSGRSTCMAEMSRSPLAAWPTSNPSSSIASVSISRVSRARRPAWVSPAATALGIERDRLVLPVGAADQQLHPALRLVELAGRLPGQPDSLGELLDGLLERELPDS